MKKDSVFCLEDISNYLVERLKSKDSHSIEILKDLILDVETFNISGTTKKKAVIKAMETIFHDKVSDDELNILIDTMVLMLNTTIKVKRCLPTI